MGFATHDIVLKYDKVETDGLDRDRPYLVRCSCQTEGRFESEEKALDYVFLHQTNARSVNITFQNLSHRAKAAS